MTQAKDARERVEEALTNDEAEEASGTFARYREDVIQELCGKCEAELKYNRKGEYTLFSQSFFQSSGVGTVDFARFEYMGDPRFCARFGFQSDSWLLVPEAPPEVTLSLRFRHCDDRGTVTFHPAFMAALARAEGAT